MHRRSLLRAALVVAAIATWVPAGRAADVVVRTVDDATLSGANVTVADGRLTLTPSATTRPTTGPTTGPTAVTSPTVLPLADVVDVVLGAAAVPTTAPAAPAAKPKRGRGKAARSAATRPAATRPATTRAATGPTTRPIAWLVKLADGDRAHGTVDAWADGRLTVRPAASAGSAAMAVRSDQLSEAWAGAAATDAGLQSTARALVPADAAGDDVALVRKDATTVTPVRGTALGLAGDALAFRFDGQARRIAVAKLVGVVFAHRSAAPATGGARFTAHLPDGDLITGEWVSLDKGELVLRPATGQLVTLSAATVSRVSAVGGRVVYVSDLKPIKVEQVPYFGRLVPYRLDRSLSGGPMKLPDGTTVAKGVAVHGRCVLEYDLGGAFDRFRATVAFEQPGGSAAVRVVADGRAVYDAAAATGATPPAKVDVDLTGVRRLSLVVDFPSDGGGDVQARVDWADARLRRPAPAAGPTTREGRP